MASIQQMVTGLRWIFTRISMKHSNKALEITIKLVLVKLEDDIKVRVTANADNARVLTLHI